MTDVAVAGERAVPGPTRAPGGALPLPRRSAVPTGRAVVGGFLVALSALGLFVAWTRAAAGPQATYVVARHDVPVGARLTADDLTVLPMDLPDEVVRHAVFSRPATLVGATTVGPIRRGELVQAGDVVRKRAGADQLEVSFAVDASRAVAGSLREGELVDVASTFGSGATAYTVTVVRQARVLDVGVDGDSLTRNRTQVISLAVRSSDEALALSHAVNAGEVTLVRSTGTSVSGPVGQTYTAPAVERSSSGD